jgi:hypothetical protein
MQPDISRLVAKIRDAGVVPETWPEALKSLTEILGIAGAACIISNKMTGRVDWVCFSGLSAEFEADYINHYAPLDPFAPMLDVGSGWMKLSESPPDPVLRKSEWYNDFVLSCGVGDILAARLAETRSHFVTFGLHQQIGRSFGDSTASIMNDIADFLVSATLHHVEHLRALPPNEKISKVDVRRARYYFHVVNGKRYPDETGTVLSCHQEAVEYAAVVAAELAQDGNWEDFMVLVTDAGGRAIAQIAVR